MTENGQIWLQDKIFLLLTTMSVGHDLLPFYASDFDIIWYAHYMHQYAWRFFVVFSNYNFFDKIIVFRTLQLGQIQTIYCRFINPIWIQFCMYFTYTNCIDVGRGFTIQFFYRLNTQFYHLATHSVRHALLPLYPSNLDRMSYVARICFT